MSLETGARGPISEQHKKIIETYYNATQKFYKYFWHKDVWDKIFLGKDALGLHYGLWTPDVKNRVDAIIEENRVLADLAGVKKGDLVLDAGCGIGGSGIWLAENRGAKVISIDIVDKQIIKGQHLVNKRKLDQQIKFKNGDYQSLPLDDNTFDVFWSLESIEHATDIPSFMKEAFRVLKPGGKLVIAGTFRGDKENITSEEQEQIDVFKAVAGVFNDFRTPKAVIQLMTETGFVVDPQDSDKTNLIMKSAEQLVKMCRWGVPVAKFLSAVHAVSPVLVGNNKWGTSQKELFEKKVTSYNIILATKPK